MDWFYYNLYEPLHDNPEFVEIERVYCFAFDIFTDADWQSLNDIYNRLPERRTNTPDGCPWWFGVDEESEPFLWASVEPPGLQVYGVLRPGDWIKWDTAFRSQAEELPKRQV